MRGEPSSSSAGPPLGRRRLLADAAAGTIAAAATLAADGQGERAAAAAGRVAGDQAPPPHAAVHLEGVHAYAADSVRAGDTIRFHVSSSVDYRFSLVRLGVEPGDTTADVVLCELAGRRAAHPIHPGSYVHVERPPALQDAVTLSCWFRAFRGNGPRQAILARRRDDAAGGYGIFLDERRLVLECGPRGPAGRLEAADARIVMHRWHHAAAVIEPRRLTLFLDGLPVAERRLERDAGPGLDVAAPLRLGGAGEGPLAGHFLDGDLACAAIYGVPLAADAVRGIWTARGLGTVMAPPPLAWWDFSEERGERVGDATGHGHDGRIVNAGTWMIGGPSFDARSVGRHDAYDPAADPSRGHGLRLAADDLVDCGWPVAHELGIPADAPSGFHCGRFEYEADGRTMQHNVTFVVRPAASAPPAPIVVLAATATWRAYNWFPFTANRPAGRHDWRQASVADGADPRLPAGCFYRDHRAGQPTYKVGLRVPCESADPYRCYRGHDRWGQWVACERRLHLWLDRHGYDYEVMTDLDLDAEPAALDGRRVLVIVGHSEYWTLRAYGAVERFLRGGGSVVVLSGNTMFWRTERAGEAILECRKYATGIHGRPWTQPGELYHGQGRRRGGLLRFCGAPGWKLIGLETAGWCKDLEFLSYTATAADHPLFHEPHEVGVAQGEAFGFFGDLGVVGHEYDVRPGILAAATAALPPGCGDVADPPGITVLAQCRSGRRIADYHATANMTHDNPSGVISEIILWERPDGGRVFNIGSVSAAWGVHEDERLGRLLRNVLHRFGIRT